MAKRKFDEFMEELEGELGKPAVVKPAFQNSLDSDEEDDEEKAEKYNVMNPEEFEGVEDGPAAKETNTGFTAFNMKEEEEGHFDAEGHYHWNKEKEIRDNWLDNIDWVKVKPKADDVKTEDDKSDEESDFMYDPIPSYKKLLEFLKPDETVQKALYRLGAGKKKLSTAERWKRKKDPNATKEEDENSLNITKLTEIANDLLTRTGNMDIYQENYKQIERRIQLAGKHSHPLKVEAELDMFSDDFDTKEEKKVDASNIKTEEPAEAQQISSSSNAADEDDATSGGGGEVLWEFKWSQNDGSQVHGPHTSAQMQAWSSEGYFKKGAWVRKRGQSGDFYNVGRIDFELYM